MPDCRHFIPVGGLKNRRLTLLGLLAFAGAPLFKIQTLHAADGTRSVSGKRARAFMLKAEELRDMAVEAGDQAYGAVVVRGDEIVGFGPSRVATNIDPTAHAEMEAIRDASRRLGMRDLSACVMYSTSKPCRMCETAAYWANVSRMHFGQALTDAGPPGYC